MNNKAALVFSFFLLACTLQGAAFSHPADGRTPNPLPEGYGTDSYILGPEEGIGEMTFTCPYPSPDSLTPAEKYMIAGSMNGPRGPMEPWVKTIGQLVSFFYLQEGYLPDVISEEMIKKVLGSSTDEPWRTNIYKSPVTDSFPRLDAQNFSRGSVFAHIMTEDEKLDFARDKPELQKMWFDKTTEREGQQRDLLPMPVAYIRAYGENTVILEYVFVMAAITNN